MSRFVVPFLSVLLVISLGACGDNSGPASPPPEDGTGAVDPREGQTTNSDVTISVPDITERSIPKNVPTTDEPIILPSAATGLAFWEHPTLNFEGMVIAATQTGIYAHTLEGVEPVSTVPDINASGAALAYIQPNQRREDPGSASVTSSDLIGMFLTYNKGQHAYQLYEIDNLTRELLPVSLTMGSPENQETADPEGFCFFQDSSGEADPQLSLVDLANQRATLWRVRRDEKGLWSRQLGGAYTLSSQSVSCIYDPILNNIYVLDQNGVVHLLDDQGNSSTVFINTGMKDASALHLHMRVTQEGPASVLAVLGGASGQVQIFNGNDGALLGIVRLADFDDKDGVIQASALAIASGNYGALYRGGVLALGADERVVLDGAGTSQNNDEISISEADQDQLQTIAAVRLTPFLAVINMLTLPTQATMDERQSVDQRESSSDADSQAIRIDLEDIQLNP